MRLYFAPLEGITTYTYRNTHAELFGGCDAYYAPFITPSDNERLSVKCLRDIVPENNNGDLRLVPQVLTNRAASFFKFERELSAIGYRSVNINLGCPSGTVVKKGRGAGFLKNPDGIDAFLAEVFEGSKLEISVKSRIGFYTGDELVRLMEIYNGYPLSKLIIHPRTRADFYNGEPSRELFGKACKVSKNRLCFNGNVFSAEDFVRTAEEFPELEGVMLGRGAVANPAIFREIRGGKPLEARELSEFTDRLAERYLKVLGSETFTLHKLKEIWMYMMWGFPSEKKILKAIKKATRLRELTAAIRCLPEVSER